MCWSKTEILIYLQHGNTKFRIRLENNVIKVLSFTFALIFLIVNCSVNVCIIDYRVNDFIVLQNAAITKVANCM